MEACMNEGGAEAAPGEQFWAQLEMDLMMHGRVEYFIGQLERGEDTGKVHLQAVLCFSTKQHESAIRKLFGMGYGYSRSVAKLDEACAYCSKEETRVAGPFIYGVKPAGQGERSDLKPLDAMAQALHNGADFVQTVMSNPTAASRGLKMLQAVARPVCRYHVTSLLHLYGETGKGKTQGVIALLNENDWLKEHVYWKSPYTKWWDEYNGQAICIIDDMDHLEPPWKYKEMLSLLDSKPFQVEIKGGTRQFTSHLVVFLTSASVNNWYPLRHGELSELQRRFDDFGREIHITDGTAHKYSEVAKQAFFDAVKLLVDQGIITAKVDPAIEEGTTGAEVPKSHGPSAEVPELDDDASMFPIDRNAWDAFLEDNSPKLFGITARDVLPQALPSVLPQLNPAPHSALLSEAPIVHPSQLPLSSLGMSFDF